MMNIVPAGETIADLEKEALEYEQAAQEQPAAAADLNKLAMVRREWARVLNSGMWTS
jgi:hypothetical protein